MITLSTVLQVEEVEWEPGSTTKLVTCGTKHVRFWKLRGNVLQVAKSVLYYHVYFLCIMCLLCGAVFFSPGHFPYVISSCIFFFPTGERVPSLIIYL